MVAGLALLVILGVAAATGVKPDDLGILWPIGWAGGIVTTLVGAAGSVYSLIPHSRYRVKLAFLPPTIVTVPLTEIRTEVLASGSNFSIAQRQVISKHVTYLEVARARLKNVSDSTHADAEDLAASIGVWSGVRTTRISPIRARWSLTREFWQTGDRAAISDRITLPFLGETLMDLAIKYPNQSDAYGYNTDSTIDGLDWRKPEWRLPVGIYTLRVLVRGTPDVKPIEAWLELRNREDALEIRLRGRPFLAGFRHQPDRRMEPDWGRRSEPEAIKRGKALLASAHVHDMPHDPKRDKDGEQIPLTPGEPDPSVCHDCGRSLINDVGTERLLLCPKLHGRRPPSLRPKLFDGAVECGQPDS